MNTTKLKLTNPTDDELSAAVAEHVAGWRYVGMAATIGCDPRMWANGTPGASDYVMRGQDQFRYAISADAVLPLLLNAGYVNINLDPFSKVWSVAILNGKEFVGNSPVLPRAACIALLRANGVEVIT